MEITEKKRKNSVVLELKGRLDAVSSDGLGSKIQGLVDSGERHLILDFSDLNYISSSGFRVLLMAAKRVKAVNGKLALVSLNDQNQAVLGIAGFSSVFTVYQSQDEAVNSRSWVILSLPLDGWSAMEGQLVITLPDGNNKTVRLEKDRWSIGRSGETAGFVFVALMLPNLLLKLKARRARVGFVHA